MSNTTICIISKRSGLIMHWLYNNYKENFRRDKSGNCLCKDKIITFIDPDYICMPIKIIQDKVVILNDWNYDDVILLTRSIYIEKACEISYNTLNEDILISEIEK